MTAGIDDTGKITRNPDTETAVLAGGCFEAWRICSVASRAWLTPVSATRERRERSPDLP